MQHVGIYTWNNKEDNLCRLLFHIRYRQTCRQKNKIESLQFQMRNGVSFAHSSKGIQKQNYNFNFLAAHLC
ncbi:hypothetical protein JTE90_007812 [Oedothorax gibbosus]|uniref:Uncharacterized protein n=1 Tax=Oedothorax gibbosus TaxID=931172 RepID=A0AAV6VHQ4_9ARAC|nr:hypothetical protein JTE90_007812 [Oedothorax gibbosus]